MLQLALTTQDATLVAAAIAAAASMAKLVADVVSARGLAGRAAHRAILEPHLVSLGTAIHEITAGVVVVHTRAKQGQAPGAALQHAKAAAQSLKQQRLGLKYSLSGADEALRVLTRGPDWVATYKGHASGDAFVEQLQALARQLDTVVERSYRRGRPPVWLERRRMTKQGLEVRAAWEARFGRDPAP